MNLQIRDPQARKLAERLARVENKTMSKAVVDALDFKLKHVEPKRSVAEIAAEIRAEFAAMGKPGGHLMTKDEIDDMWWG